MFSPLLRTDPNAPAGAAGVDATDATSTPLAVVDENQALVVDGDCAISAPLNSVSAAISPCASSNSLGDPADAAAAAVVAAHPTVPQPAAAPPAAAQRAVLVEEEEEESEEEEEESEEEEDEDVFNPYAFMGGLPDHKTVRVRNKIVLPPLPAGWPSQKLSLVLDLDETLVHCTVDKVANPDLIFPVK
jgi:hypothetical protein